MERGITYCLHSLLFHFSDCTETGKENMLLGFFFKVQAELSFENNLKGIFIKWSEKLNTTNPKLCSRECFQSTGN